MTKPTTIAEGQLLEFSKDEDIIDGAEWNVVMSNIKRAINNHAGIIGQFKTNYYTKTIKPEDWDSTDKPHEYICYIPGSEHKTNGIIELICYAITDSSFKRVSINYNLDIDTGTITLKSRIRETLVIGVQGVTEE